MKVFYSWQSDLRSATHRNLIRTALTDAITELSDELDVEDAERPEVDEATKNEVGMVDIAATILRKISGSAAFVADLSPIGKAGGGRVVSNPNVVFELGYAYANPGPQAIVGVMNTISYSPEQLPFDVRGKRILQYSLADDASDKTRRAVRLQLKKDFVDALRLILKQQIASRASETVIEGVAVDPEDTAIWKGTRAFRFPYGFKGEQRNLVRIAHAKHRAYVRVIPAAWPKASIRDVIESANDVWPAHRGNTIGDFGAVDFGYVKLWCSDKDEAGYFATNVAAFHQDSGEWWFIESASVFEYGGQTYFDPLLTLSNWRRAIRMANASLDRLNAPLTRKIIVGVSSVQDAQWPDRGSHIFRKPGLEVSHQRERWTAIDEASLLFDAYNDVRDGFSMPYLLREQFDELLDKVSGQ
jgi:hypothetical protein